MNLFHHIVIFRMTEDEKRDFVKAGVEFTRTMKTSRGETGTFEIGESDSRYERIAALLRSLETKRFRDDSMTVPTLREFIAKTLPSAERLKEEGYFSMQAKWKRGREVAQQSLELAKAGQTEQALNFLDTGIAEAIQENNSWWVSRLCRRAATFARLIGDRQRQIRYEEQALPFAKDYPFAAYNFAQLLFSDGQVARSEQHAAEAYRQSIAQATEADRDLVAAILRRWPNVTQNR